MNEVVTTNVNDCNSVLFGNDLNVPDKVTLVIDTRMPDEKSSEAASLSNTSAKIFNLPCLPRWEPPDCKLFCKQLHAACDEIVKDRDVIYIIDTIGASRSAMVAAIILRLVFNYAPSDAIRVVEESYLRQNTRNPIWWITGIPICPRHKMFAEWQVLGVTWKNFCSRKRSKALGVRRRNRANGIAGTVRSVQMPYTGRSPSTKLLYLDGFEIYKMGTPTAEYGKLHPGKIGRVRFLRASRSGRLLYDVSDSLQNLLIACQVFQCHIKTLANEKPQLTSQWYETFLDLVGKTEVHKVHPDAKMMLGKVEEPVFYMWQGIKLNKLQFRIIVFCNMYEKCVKNTEAFRDLQLNHQGGSNMELLDYDSCDHFEYGMSLRQALVDENIPWGHSMVLKGMLEGDRPWTEEEILLEVS